jgi:N-ethylmaleimide reductase
VTGDALFAPLTLGGRALQHRIVLPPLTRSRAQGGNVPGALIRQYYAQRATRGGLLVTEGSQISARAQGSPATPGIHSPEQLRGWAAVVRAVHARGGVIFLQLWHVGRASHSSLQPGGCRPVAPSPVPIRHARFRLDDGTEVPFEVPHALTIAEIGAVIAEYAAAARNAYVAGFDGVEIHGANGYLIEQFLQSHTNRRHDAYGGSIAGRVRFLDEVIAAVIDVWGAERVGLRLSPYGISNESGEPDPVPLYAAATDVAEAHGLAYLHLIEPRASGVAKRELDRAEMPAVGALFRDRFSRAIISSGGYTVDTARAAIVAGHADLVGFGRHFIANPDLPERLRRGAALNHYDRATFYTPGSRGYTDYPVLRAG